MKIGLFLFILLADLGVLLGLIFRLIQYLIALIRGKEMLSVASVLKKNMIVFIGVLGISILLILLSRVMAHTPKIRDDNGNVIEESVAELISLEINGHKEWISIRGNNSEAPVILFLAGGPGGTQMAATRYELGELEKNYVVVNWDQPGSGKSYNCMKRSDITVETYVEDGIAVTEYLRERFKKEQIYLIGESWGSALGIFMADRAPQYYAGIIGTGQMVDFKETEKIDYQMAIMMAQEKGDEDTVLKLQKQGEPPYYDGNIALTSANYLNYLSNEMASDPNITNGGYQTLRDMFAAEYDIVDTVHFLLGVMNTFNVVYPQLYETDLRRDYNSLDVPVYFFLGRHDINAPTTLAEEYYEILDCPKKEIVWFEHSGHNPWINEKERFVKETLLRFEPADTSSE